MPALICGILAIFIFAMASNDGPMDNTDPPNGRSGMGLHTDCLTGLQYLSQYRGALVPRLNAEGKHIQDFTGCK